MLLGIDIGGTHTDAVALDPGGLAASVKVPTDHDDLLASVTNALEKILAQVDGKSITQLNLSTTLSTNAIVQGRLEDVGMLVSSGPGIDPDNYMLCKQFHILDASIDHRGDEIKPLDKEQVSRAVDACLGDGVKVFGAVTKFCTRNPDQEKAMGRALDGKADFVTLGHELAGRLGFPRRIATVFFNCAVWRLYNRFADAIAQSLADMGLNVAVNILKADGGTMPLALSRTRPVQSIFSGPAASVMGIIALCDIFHDSIIYDIGGTTTDIAIFVSGAPLIEHEGIQIGSHPTLVQALKVRSIGVGGDSAVSVRGGVVRVGPNRLGPSVAAGGEIPTLTDALNFAGQAAFGDVQASVAALEDLAAENGMEPEALAQGAVDAAVDTIHDETRAFVAEINEKPVYTIHELLEDRRITPRKIYLMGGPAEAMKRPLFAKFKLSCEVPNNYQVANAVGAALTKTTTDVVLFADTQKGVVLIPSLNYQGTADRSYNQEAAEAQARRHLLAHLRDMGAKVDEEDVKITASSSFNMVQGMSAVGRTIRVRCQVKPGTAFTLAKEKNA